MTVLYQNLCYNEVCCKGTALYCYICCYHLLLNVLFTILIYLELWGSSAK